MDGGTPLFIQKFFQSPKQVGSLFPSSLSLAKKMTTQLCWDHIDIAAELGAGTGVITKEIVRNLKPDSEFYIFEKEEEMRKKLTLHFNNHTVCEDARHILISSGKEEATMDAIFSGLPFANFTRSLQREIVEEVYRALRPGGVFVAFQYSTQMKRTFQEVFRTVEIAFVPKNFPPAFVYTCEK
ncbi:class I SAM-dependent methyltransferase [Fictibacillus phosphorivorans]|uniref:class I SAM-dependent methyltransferase n=1 Tax=Fictibacillus phosphorivorans TaxID=1221500 RepID=UPI002AD3C2A0|nr:methyltransferase domain-containing protein [Fictibacillus phosphorivorans]